MGEPVQPGVDFAHVGPGAGRQPGFFGICGLARSFASSRFETRAFGLAGAGLLLGASGPPFLIAGAGGGAGRFAEPRWCAVRAALLITIEVALEITPVVAVRAPATALTVLPGGRAGCQAVVRFGFGLRLRIVE